MQHQERRVCLIHALTVYGLSLSIALTEWTQPRYCIDSNGLSLGIALTPKITLDLAPVLHRNTWTQPRFHINTFPKSNKTLSKTVIFLQKISQLILYCYFITSSTFNCIKNTFLRKTKFLMFLVIFSKLAEMDLASVLH